MVAMHYEAQQTKQQSRYGFNENKNKKMWPMKFLCVTECLSLIQQRIKVVMNKFGH